MREYKGFTEKTAEKYLLDHGWSYWHPNCKAGCGYRSPYNGIGFAWAGAIEEQKKREQGKQLNLFAPNIACTPTGFSAPVVWVLSTPENIPSNQADTTPPTSG